MTVSRRQLLAGLLAGAALAGCDAAVLRTEPEPVEEPLPVGLSRPERLVSFGPNGTHWPADTPWLHDRVAYELDADCSWSDIGNALSTVTPEQAAAGVHIRVAPGTLTGEGGGSSGRPVLRGVGSTMWERRVLVSPREGYGSVTLTGDTKLHQVHGVAFALLYGDQVTLSSCSRSALCWSSVDGWIVQAVADGPGSITEHCDLYEVVVDRPRLQSSDPTGLAAGYTRNSGGPADGNGMLRNCTVEGCYTAPRWRAAGDDDHVDTCQTYSGGGLSYGFIFRDTALWASNNCALQASGVPENVAHYLDADAGPHVTLDHSLLVGTKTSATARYAIPAGGSKVSSNQAINGAGGVQGMSAWDSIIAGSIYPSTWRQVVNTTIPATRDVARVLDGAWTVNPALLDAESSYFDTICPRPTEDYLRNIWR